MFDPGNLVTILEAKRLVLIDPNYTNNLKKADLE